MFVKQYTFRVIKINKDWPQKTISETDKIYSNFPSPDQIYITS